MHALTRYTVVTTEDMPPITACAEAQEDVANRLFQATVLSPHDWLTSDADIFLIIWIRGKCIPFVIWDAVRYVVYKYNGNASQSIARRVAYAPASQHTPQIISTSSSSLAHRTATSFSSIRKGSSQCLCASHYGYKYAAEKNKYVCSDNAFFVLCALRPA